MRWWSRRGIVAAVIALQISALVGAYGRPHKVFGWQMFNASSDWRADVARVTADGERHDVREPWPGGYVWAELVSGRGFDTPFLRQHAHAGLDTTIDLFQSALDWVALNTPADRETVQIEARLTMWDNGRAPEQLVLRSAIREAVP